MQTEWGRLWIGYLYGKHDTKWNLPFIISDCFLRNRGHKSEDILRDILFFQ